MFKLIILFATRSAPHEVPLHELVVERDRIRKSLPGVGSRVYLSTLTMGEEHSEAMNGQAAFAAVLEAWTDGASAEALLEAVDGMTSRLGPWIDVPESAVVAGEEITVVPGDKPLRLAMALHRRASMTPAAFRGYWKNRHAELGRRVPGSEGYSQLHADAGLSRRAAEVSGIGRHDFDGVAQACFTDEPTFTAHMARTDVLAPLLEDEKKFIDHANSAAVIGLVAP